MQYYHIILYIIFGTLPSLILLFYYLKKDLHPEPKKMILKVFLYGALVTIPVFIIQINLYELLRVLQSFTFFSDFPIIISILKWFVVIALIEEVLKYFVIKFVVLKNKELDEPLDIMLYMVVAALGFTAVENILYLFSSPYNFSLETTITSIFFISAFRSIATFFHTLCSALLGYFLALSILKRKRGFLLIAIGILLATLLHGLYDFSIMELYSPLGYIIPIIIVVGLSIFMIYDFNEIKKIKSICKL